ncbi:tetratricopeptide repeat protein [Mariniflexile ostreae]|uniref:Tetratricopeptide repeat protein n=1 Tax=Mariniflexile ostreae TaxID=1520892 RepID=A0ABV5F732_9FLAO
MKHSIYILFLIFGIVFFPQLNYAQVDLNKKPEDDLGNYEDAFQEHFFEALKQKSIENYDRAAKALLKCIDIDNAVPVLYFELGKIYVKLKNFGDAERALKKAVSKASDNEWFLDELYALYVSQQDTKKSIKIVKQLVAYHPDYREDLASLYFKEKKYSNALEILDGMDAEFGISVSRDLMRNQIYEVTGRKKEQIENLEGRIENNPDKESNYLALIFRYSENNETKKAFQTAKELLKTNPNSQMVHLALYKFYLDDKETEKAIESMKIVIKSPQIKPDAKQKVLLDFIDFVKAHPKYEPDLVEATTLVEATNSEKTLLELGQYYLKIENKAKALSYFEAALRVQPDNFAALRNVMLLHIDLQHYDAALEQSDKALQRFPSQPIFYLINGVALNQLHQEQKAVDILEAGLDYIIDDPKMEVDFYNQLSAAYTQLNNTIKAKSFTDKARKVMGSN